MISRTPSSTRTDTHFPSTTRFRFSILEAESHAKKQEDKFASKFFCDMGGFSPTLGIIGTVMGLIHVLENLSDPDKLGPLIAGAFVATLWGVFAANVDRKSTRLNSSH